MSLSEENLSNQLRLLERASIWLQRSLSQCADFNPARGLSDDEFDALEALASRYARVVDLLINKVFRAIDQIEFLEAGSLIDSVNRAEGRKLLQVAEARVLKELRNRIVHEYEVEDLASLLSDIQKNSQALLASCERAVEYSQRFSH